MNYFLVTFGPLQADTRQTESNAYAPTMQVAQVGPKIKVVPEVFLLLLWLQQEELSQDDNMCHQSVKRKFT